MSLLDLESAFHGAVTVGERGQVVIPAAAREKLGINPGEKLLAFVHPSHCGVLFMKLQALQAMTDMLEPILQALGVADEQDASESGPGEDA